MRAQGITRILVTCVAVVLLVVHLLHPAWRVDSVSVALVVIAALPWLHHIFESIEASATGFKVPYARTKEALDSAVAGSVHPIGSGQPSTAKPDVGATLGLRPEAAENRPRPDKPLWVTTEDANLALVALRIEIERRMRALGAKHGIDRPSLVVLLNELARQQIIDSRAHNGLRELISAGNRAAHGAQVDKNLGHLLTEDAPALLDALDALLRG